MISAELIDAGTYPLKNPATFPSVPGMDSMYYNELDMEEDNTNPRPHEINEGIRDAGEFDLRPWPVPFQNQCWIDNSPRYQFDGLDGFQLLLHRYDRTTGETPIVPAGETTLDLDAAKQVDNESAARLVRKLTWEETQARETNPTEWIRLDLINRASAGTDLRNPLFANWRGLAGTEFRVCVPDNVLFAPFDLSHSERYDVLDDDGDKLPDDQVEHRITLHAGGRYRLYFRPRKWRYVAFVVAHYIHATAFEYFVAQEFFTRAHTHRPPFYPIRHDLIRTTKTQSLPDYFGNYHSYDEGINWQWEHSRSAAALAHEIIDGQYWTKLVVKIFAGNEAPIVTISNRPADAGDIVFGIGRVDNYTGRETRTWIAQREDLTHLYPWTVLGSYFVPWYIAG